MSMPGSFPIDDDADTDMTRELHMNSLHTRKLRLKKLSKECFARIDLIVIMEILIIYFIDNSIVKLLLRYSLQYFLLNLNSILDDLLVMNERTFTSNDDEINARESLNNLINNLKLKYKSSLMIGIVLFNGFCIWNHLYSIELASQNDDEYLYGFCFLNVIGQLKLHQRYPLILLDVFILAQQLLLYNIKFNNTVDPEQDVEDDGYQGILQIYEINMLPHVNKNFLLDFIGLDYRVGSSHSSYGSV